MNDPASKPLSKGMAMIAAYRAERLGRRPAHRSALPDTDAARHALGPGGPVADEPGQPAVADVAPSDAIIVGTLVASAASVFAGLVSTAVAEQQDEALPMRYAEADTVAGMRPDASDDAGAGPAEAEGFSPELPAIEDEGGSGPAVAPEPPYDPPLAEIGFGPGMLIRLSQLGFHTTSDLAQANAVQLRSELGDISRLVDVDAWIRSARQSSRAAPGDPSAGR